MPSTRAGVRSQRPPGKWAWRKLKPGQPLRLADNRLGNQPPGQAGQRHAMA